MPRRLRQRVLHRTHHIQCNFKMRISEEIFGPVVSIIKAKHHALK
jgi:hypothetical protein